MSDIPAGVRRHKRRAARAAAPEEGSASSVESKGSGFRAPIRYLGLFLLGAVAALAGMGLIPASEQRLGPIAVATSARLGRPGTTLEVPPVGAVSARTHGAPLAVTLAVTEVDPVAVGEMLSSTPDQEALIGQLSEAIQKAASGLGIRILVGGLVLGGLVLALVPGRRWSWIVAGVLGGLVGTATLLALTWIAFRPEAFREPSFTGSLERAPQLIRAIEDQNVTLDQARSAFREPRPGCPGFSPCWAGRSATRARTAWRFCISATSTRTHWDSSLPGSSPRVSRSTQSSTRAI